MLSGRRFPVIGLIGGIGSGKSTVARRLAEIRDVRLIDADQLGHAALADEQVQQQLRSAFGDEIFQPDGTIRRSVLAALVFGSDRRHIAARRKLEEITHPFITREMQRRLEQFQADPPEAVVLDAPLLLEAGWDQVCDAVVFVDTPEPIRRQRVSSRGWSDDEWTRREQAQWPVEQKLKRADVCIRNDAAVDMAAEQLAEIVDRLRAGKPAS